MDFRLDDEQQALQEGIERWCAGRWPLAQASERPLDLDRAAWAELVDLGLTTLLAPEARGGLGLGAVEAVAVLEPLGRHLVPGPVLWATLGGATGDEGVLGTDLVTGVVDDGARPLFVEHGQQADAVLVLGEDEVHLVDRAALDLEPHAEPLDPYTPVASATTVPEGRVLASGDEAVRLRRIGTVLAAALQTGVSQAALDVAVEYALEREQFGVPIGSFQALKHMMADMYVRTGLARSATYAAAAVLDDPVVGHVARSVGGAKLLAGEAALDNARAAIQVLGGMGFTWEMPPHLLLKRAWVLEQGLGTSGAHARAIAASLADEADAAEGTAA